MFAVVRQQADRFFSVIEGQAQTEFVPGQPVRPSAPGGRLFVFVRSVPAMKFAQAVALAQAARVAVFRCEVGAAEASLGENFRAYRSVHSTDDVVFSDCVTLLGEPLHVIDLSA